MEETFGEFLRARRQAKGMSIRQLALYANCSDSYLSLLERGIAGGRGPTPNFLLKLSKALRIPHEVLMRKAGHCTDHPTEVVTVPFLPLLRECLADSLEDFAERTGISLEEIQHLEESKDVSAETVMLIFDMLFCKQRAFTRGQQTLLNLVEKTFQKDSKLSPQLESLLTWFFEAQGAPAAKAEGAGLFTVLIFKKEDWCAKKARSGSCAELFF
ncbi:hypothetical protein CBW65_10020 [Tumebacillus avium]|uniref:HTH cro/C1-type domain-containing protein n=1 Tax=Tumebacillus avium TaxID=1903704 RepID=A0A1Y0IPL1_9BACL|nr:helix-turn-helix transcriptional regulator [Tumebacillus avium]ARU61293.1 hypothetical protein CBW65_10020 [Tumebacillus avium]